MFKPKSQSSQLVGRRNVVGEKDRKALRAQFNAQYPTHGVEAFNQLFPQGEAMSVLSLKGSSVEVFLSDDVPCFFVQSKKKTAQLVPTLFTLWRLPTLLPSIVCQAQAPRYLIRGADLMLPGCIPQDPNGRFPEHMDAGQLWAVRVLGNPVPFAVGSIIMSQTELQSASKGKLLEVYHILGDLLFRSYTPATLPEGFTASSCVPITGEAAETAAAESETEKPTGETAPAETTKEETSNVEAVSDGSALDRREQVSAPDSDAKSEADSSDTGGDSGANTRLVECTVEYCLLEVLKKQLPDSALPIDVSAVWGKMTQILQTVLTSETEFQQFLSQRGVSPTETQMAELPSQFDLRRTSWKSLKKMANHFKKTKIWQLKELRGTITVVKVNRVHPVLTGHRSLPDSVLPADQAKSSKGTRGAKVEKRKDVDHEGGGGPLSFVPVTAYQATAQTRELLAAEGAFEDGRSPDSLFLEEDVRRLLDKILLRLRNMDPAAGEVFPSLDKSAPPQAPAAPGDAALLSRDARMLNICLTKSERQTVKTGGPPPVLSGAQILKRFLSNGMKVVTLLLGGGSASSMEEALKKPSEYDMIEADAKITVSTQRTKRFTRTKVAGIHMFPMIDPKQLAERLQKACAAAATVCELDELKGKSKPLGVIVQGAVVREVCDVLEKQYGIPRNMLVSGP
eukprot:Gregarina_sp_Pseudo_9__721@NODE_145_length_3959_cov_13_780867_g133_i0_p1_GENE_NODE_145_length_3959_cov_13_780867_g133_i0NODE_145_length_3959_cov_13_780867_g133_i0_p1_ORF_typecomplete_len681_score265_60PrePUA/PF17832_1/3_3e12PrePUA/PF17832_1/1_5e04SUI1/PF01253_22/9_3e03SUI1/PF01253_22/4_8e08PUA/PF01472_20/4_4e03PUA/PF01472_20/6_7e07DUF1947/PF09183_10/0_44_NODE_145_length_3959_cov_13_780867_g133_i018613903